MSASPSATEARSASQGRIIPRARLSAQLTDALSSGSVILTAAAGFGKTTALEQALARADARVAWVSCSDTERGPGNLLMRIVDVVADATPGVSDAFAERLATSAEPVDAPAALRALIADFSRLLLEPLVIVFDDAEHLGGADQSLGLIANLIRAEVRSLHVAVATRRKLDLRLGKPRAAGRLTELTAAELAFDAKECEAIMRARALADPQPDQVEQLMSVTEGWPLGVALAVGLIERGKEDAGPRAALDAVGSAPDIRTYLSEELFDSLEPELREAAIDSSVVRVVTPELIGSLGLNSDLGDRLERAGVLTRPVGDTSSFAYHPLVREFLLARFRSERNEAERRSRHAAVAPVLASGGDAIEAIEHWLEADDWRQALAAIESGGAALIRSSPDLVASWLARLPADARGDPRPLLLAGQVEWGAGQHEQARAPLAEAIRGFRKSGEVRQEWLARMVLADALLSAGEFERMLDLGEGWDEESLSPEAHVSAAGIAWYQVLALTGLGRIEDAQKLAARLREDPRTAAQFRDLEAVHVETIDLAAGRGDETIVQMRATIRELELDDPHGRLPYPLAMIVLAYLDLGDDDSAMSALDRSQLEAERLGLGFVARDAYLQRAALLARRGELAAAERSLARAGQRRGAGWRGVSRHKAEALVADARGDAGEAVAAAERGLERVRAGPTSFRVWTAIDMAVVLAENGSPERARAAIEEAISALDRDFPGASGRHHRARLLATRAWLEFEGGDRSRAYDDLRRSWAESGDGARHLVRADWSKLEPVLWQALADGAIDPETVLPDLESGLPGGAALIAFTDHPTDAVRGAALPAALAANHPTVLSRLSELIEDRDPGVAEAALATRDRLRRDPPPVSFGLLGRFRVTRAGWEIEQDAWGRPIDTRLIRFLLVNLNGPIPEDRIFEALWPDLPASSARRSLQVAVSRVRRVLDPPGADESLIEGGERAYRIALGERDKVDVDEFRVAAEIALDSAGYERPRLLDRARSLWAGEPLPEERYSDWATSHREWLTDRYIAVLNALVAGYEGDGAHAHAIDAARELVQLDPLNEAGHRALMAAYARTGRRGHALRQFLECRRALVDTLGVEPAEATARLQARILAGEAV